MPSWFPPVFGANGFSVWDWSRPSLAQLLHSPGPQEGCHRQVDKGPQCTLGSLTIPWEELPFTYSHMDKILLTAHRAIKMTMLLSSDSQCHSSSSPFRNWNKSPSQEACTGPHPLPPRGKIHILHLSTGHIPFQALFPSWALIVPNIPLLFYLFHSVVPPVECRLREGWHFWLLCSLLVPRQQQ